MLSDVVAEQVSRRRRASGLNREELAARCAAVGWPMSASTIANIETGRRSADGSRRREVTVDELVAFASALGIAPVLLVFPVGQRRTTEFLDGTVDAWDAALWFGGQADDDPVLQVGDRREVYRLPMRIFADHEQAQQRLWLAKSQVRVLRHRSKTGDEDVLNLLEMAEATVRQTEDIVRDLERQMKDNGLAPRSVSDREKLGKS